MSRTDLILKTLAWHSRIFGEYVATPAQFLDSKTLDTTIKFHQDMCIIIRYLADHFEYGEKISHPKLIAALKTLWNHQKTITMQMSEIVEYLDLKERVSKAENVIFVDFDNKRRKS